MRLRAQDVVEYGMLIATLALVILLFCVAYGWYIEQWFDQLFDKVTHHYS